MKASAEQLNELKVDDDGITTMKSFSGTTTDIPLQNKHTWYCTVYVLDATIQFNVAVIP